MICEEHGAVYTCSLTATPGVDVTMLMFCPVCGREAIAETEIGKRRPWRSQAEMIEHFDGEILRMPPVRIDVDEGQP